jgi:trehalose 6-phosphate synthase/phosphatase
MAPSSSSHRTILVSNRLPVTFKVEGPSVEAIPSTGGLATGLRSCHEESGGVWIGWPGDLRKLTDKERSAVEAKLASLRLHPVNLSAAEVDRFYHGYCNGVIWPLFHYLMDKLPLEPQEWEFYRRVNRIFAEAVRSRYSDGDTIWVHDYHLMLLPQMLREMLPGARIGFFLHIPFPSSEILRILPRRADVLRGLLGADLIGFHTPSYLRHFSVSVLRVLGIEAEVDRISFEGREVRLGVYPMGIDAGMFEGFAGDPALRAEAEAIRRESDGARIILGVDRLDYTKGIPRRLAAFEKLLERNRNLRGKVRLIQVATPSRTEVKAYQTIKSQLDGLVGGINGRYGTARYAPVHYINRSLSQRELSVLYMAADVMAVTPLRDGLNLVAKEYAACRTDLDGVLVLSEFAGVATELSEGLIVNPYDMDGTVEALAAALNMDPGERRTRMRSLRERVCLYDVRRWASSFLEDLEAYAAENFEVRSHAMEADDHRRVLDRISSAEKVILFLDYDGTLVPLRPRPEDAVPDGDLLNLLEELSSCPGTEVHILSGRTRESMDRWLGSLSVFLHAEHGLWSRAPRTIDWTSHLAAPDSWKTKILPIFRGFTKSTPGSSIEEKSAGLVWHFRQAEPVLGAARAKELRLLLFELLSNVAVQVIAGDKVVEVRPQGIDKGSAIRRVLASRSPETLAVAVGDDRTDEDMFRALPEPGYGFHVGPQPSRAARRLADPFAARSLLDAIARGRMLVVEDP